MRRIAIFLSITTTCSLVGCNSDTQIHEPGAQINTQNIDAGAGSEFIVQIFPDSASVGRTYSLADPNWDIGCPRDNMTDKRECTISFSKGGPFVYYGAAVNPVEVCVLGHDFPGRTAMIRIDNGAAFETNEAGCISASRILSQMKSGKVFKSQYVEWPYDYSREGEVSLDGFNQAIEAVKTVQAQK